MNVYEYISVKNTNFHVCVKDYFVSPEFTAVKIFLSV